MASIQKSSRYEDELRARISEVLHYVWDPIGVRGEPNARDEYDAYVPQIYSLLQSEATAEQIAACLDGIATGSMGLNPNPKHSLLTARNLLDWRASLLQKRPEILG